MLSVRKWFPLTALMTLIAAPALAGGVVGSSGGVIDTCPAVAFSYGGGTASATCSYAQAGAPGLGINSLELFGSGTTGTSGSGGYLSFGSNGSGSASGTVSAELVPVAWYFTVTGSADPVTWSLDIGLIESGYLYSEASETGTTTGTQLVSGTTWIRVPAGTLISYELDLTLSSASDFSVSIPGAYAALDLASSEGLPEPGTAWLLPAGLLVCMLLRIMPRATIRASNDPNSLRLR